MLALPVASPAPRRAQLRGVPAAALQVCSASPFQGEQQLRSASTGGRGLPWGVGSPQPFVPGVYLRPAICMTKTLLVDASVAWRCQPGLKRRPGALNLFFHLGRTCCMQTAPGMHPWGTASRHRARTIYEKGEQSFPGKGKKLLSSPYVEGGKKAFPLFKKGK